MKPIIRHTFTFVLSFGAALVGLDLFVQGAEIQSPMENQVVEGVGLMYAPNFRLARFSEGFFLGETNSYGCLGKGAPKQREEGEIRILLLGDSFALGHTVFERHHFARRMEEVIHSATGQKTTVLNFARADFSISNIYAHYLDFASQWDHDVALFLVDQTDLDPYRLASGSFYPVPHLDGESLHFRYDFMDSPKAQEYQKFAPLLTRTTLPRFAFEFLKVVDRGNLPHLVFDKLSQANVEKIAPTSASSFGPMPELTRVTLKEIATHPRITVVLSGPTHSEYEATIAELNVPTFDLNPTFTLLEEEGVDPYFWEVTQERGHWNHQAHNAIGNQLAEDVLGQLR